MGSMEKSSYRGNIFEPLPGGRYCETPDSELVKHRDINGENNVIVIAIIGELDWKIFFLQAKQIMQLYY